MSDGMQSTEQPGRTVLQWILFFLTPSVIPLAAAVGLSREWVPANGGAWILYDVSRPIGYLGLLVAAGIALGVLIHHTTSLLWEVLMGLSIASAAAMLWYAAQIFQSPY